MPQQKIKLTSPDGKQQRIINWGSDTPPTPDEIEEVTSTPNFWAGAEPIKPSMTIKSGYPTSPIFEAAKPTEADIRAAGYEPVGPRETNLPAPKFEVPGITYKPSYPAGPVMNTEASMFAPRPETQKTITDFMNPVPGLKQAGQGVGEVFTPGQRQTGMSNIIEGLMSAGKPAILPALAFNPITTGLALAGGMAGQYGSEKLSEILGGSPETNRLVGNIGGIAGGFAGGYGGSKLNTRLNPKISELIAEPQVEVLPPETQRLLSGRPEPLRLPQFATPEPIDPRFYQGRAGVADVTQPMKQDISPVIETQIGPAGAILGKEGQALTNAELGNVTNIPAIQAAENYGIRAGAEATGFSPTETTRLLEAAQASQLPKPPVEQPKLFSPAAKEQVSSGTGYEQVFNEQGNLIKVKAGVTMYGQKGRAPSPPPNVPSKETVWRLSPEAAKKVEAVDTDLNPFKAEPPRGPFGKMVAEYRDLYDKNPVAQTFQDWFTSRAGTVLKRIAPDAYQAMYNARAEKANLYGELAGQLEGAVAKLSMTEAKNWQETLEGKATPMNDKVRLAVAASEKITGPNGAIVTLARKYGMKMAKGDEFHAVEKYWPRMPGEGFVKANEGLIADMMKQESLTRHEVINILRGAKKYGPRYGGYLNQRKGMLEGYRTDPAAYFDHVAMSVNDIINTKFFKQGDLSNKNSPLHIWIEKSKDPARARKIAEAYFNRDPAAEYGESKIANAASVWAATTKLQNIILSNLAPQAMTISRMKSAEFGRALWDTIANGQKNGEIGDSTGVLFHLQKQLASEFGAGSKIVNKGYGLKYSERTNRGFAAAVSKATAEAYFETLKINPGNKLARKELGNLVGEHPDLLLKQEALTKNQLSKAAYNGSIMTQGSVGTLDLPLYWTTNKSLPVRLILLFKKFAMNNTGLVMDLAKNNPKAFAKFVPATLLMGEAIGDTKAAIRGTGSGLIAGQNIPDSIAEEISKRGAYLTPNIPWVGRVIDNFNQGWFGGLISDLLTSTMSRGGEGLVGAIAGPIAGDVKNLINTGGSFTKLRGLALKSAPFPLALGRAIEEGLQKREGTR